MRKTNQHLPSRVYERRGKLYYVTKENVWIPLGADITIATASALALENMEPLRRYLRKSFGRLASRAKRKGVPFSLTWSECQSMLSRSRGRCAVSGIPFNLSGTSDMSRRPFAPSVDRITPSRGYVSGNCRLVCVAVNVAMNEWGLDTLRTILTAVRQSEARAKRRVY